MSMREKIAAAMYERTCANIPNRERLRTWENQGPQIREDYFAWADVALKTLLEPTEAMKAVNVAADRGPDDCAEDFTAMIRAAQEGK